MDVFLSGSSSNVFEIDSEVLDELAQAVSDLAEDFEITPNDAAMGLVDYLHKRQLVRSLQATIDEIAQ